MKSLRVLLSAAAMLVLSVSALSAQGGKVTCQDGSKSAGGRGACSGHGGIQTAAMKAAAKADEKATKTATKASNKIEKTAAKAETKIEKKAATMEKKTAAKTSAAKNDEHDAAGATAECKDHTYSHAVSHQGACSRHGGVAKFLDGKK